MFEILHEISMIHQATCTDAALATGPKILVPEFSFVHIRAVGGSAAAVEEFDERTLLFCNVENVLAAGDL